MADSITILASSAHANVGTTYQGETPTLTGWAGGGVPLASQAKGAAVDVSVYSTLRLALSVTAMSNRNGFENGYMDAASLFVALEHATSASGPWSLLHTFAPQRDIGSQRVTLGSFEAFIRASYYFARGNMPATISDRVAITWSLAGDALPEA